MILEQYYLGCLAQASYLIGDEGSGRAVVVDPRRDIEPYLAEAKERGLEITHVLLTHYHADFVAGHLELAKATGARIALGSAVPPEFEAQLLEDGDTIEFGSVRIQAMHTPGHTPESVTYLVYDLSRSAERPHAALTGDTLFIGDVGRPDLLASVGVTKEELAGMLYDSLHGKILKLDDEVLVYPAHGAGSMCGKALSSDTVSTLGAQRAGNYALQPMSKEEFVKLVSTGQPDVPQYFVHDAVLNRQRRPVLEESLVGVERALTVDEARAEMQAGAVLLDVRDADEFAAGHLAGSVNVGLSGKFATFAGYVIPPTSRIVLLGSPEQVREGATRLGRIGLDGVIGHVAGGAEALPAVGDALTSFTRQSAKDLADRLGAGERPALVDIRTPGEFEGGAIQGAVHIPVQHLVARQAEIPRDRPVVLICRSGFRSAVGASLLEREGFTALSDLRGGMNAWEELHATTP